MLVLCEYIFALNALTIVLSCKNATEDMLVQQCYCSLEAASAGFQREGTHTGSMLIEEANRRALMEQITGYNKRAEDRPLTSE